MKDFECTGDSAFCNFCDDNERCPEYSEWPVTKEVIEERQTPDEENILYVRETSN